MSFITILKVILDLDVVHLALAVELLYYGNIYHESFTLNIVADFEQRINVKIIKSMFKNNFLDLKCPF